MIPRLIHQIWIGPKPLPDHLAAYGRGVRAAHRGWTFRLWDDAAVDALLRDRFPAHRDVYAKVPSYAQKADFARYMILFVHGGLYLDTDCECLRPIDFLAPEDELIVAPELVTRSARVRRLYRTLRGELYCQWAFLARPGHPFLARLVDEVASRLTRTLSPDPFVNVVDQSGPGVFTDVLLRHRAAGGPVRLVPGSWFGCPDGRSLFHFSRSFLFPRLGRTVYIRHHAELSWVPPEEKRRWMIRSFFFLPPPRPLQWGDPGAGPGPGIEDKA